MDKKSRSFRLKNGVAQGSVLTPNLYNIYTADFLKTSGNCFMYADDVAITYSASSIAKVKENLSNDMKTICKYLHDWHIKHSQSKTVSSLFHLENHLASKSIKVTLDPNTILNCERYPKYLVITLDRSLTCKNHLHKLKQKVSSRVALVRKLSRTNWGTSFDTLRTSTTAPVLAPAEYCAPVWCQSTHTKTLDVPLNEAMRIVSGCIRPTPLNFLPPHSEIQPPSCLRKKNSVNAYTTKQKTLTIFYTTSCTAKPSQKA